MSSGVKKIFYPEFVHFLGRNTITPRAEWEAAKQGARFRFSQREKDSKGNHLVVASFFSHDLSFRTSRRANWAQKCRENARCGVAFHLARMFHE
jgi:hypothetical protein